jgi:CDP-diglyceride synthetase
MNQESFYKFRAWLYRVLSVGILPLAGIYGFADQNEAALYIGLFGAILGNTLAVINTDNVRQWAYGIVLAVQAIVVYQNLFSETEAQLWVNFVAVLIGLAGTTTATVNTDAGTSFDAPDTTVEVRTPHA